MPKKTNNIKQVTEDKIELTPAGLKEIEEELRELEEEKLPQVLRRIAVAREMGDLSENSEYHSARDEKTLIETRISQIKDVLSRAKVVHKSRSDKTIGMGNVVKVKRKGDGQVFTFTIAGEFEADPKNGKISIASPVGKALLDKSKGESVKVEIPAGVVEYKILSIK